MQLSSWSLYTTTHFIEACCGLILFRATDPKFRTVRNSWVVPDAEHSLGGSRAWKRAIPERLRLAGEQPVREVRGLLRKVNPDDTKIRYTPQERAFPLASGETYPEQKW